MHKDNILFYMKKNLPSSVALTSDKVSMTFAQLEIASEIIAQNIIHKNIKHSRVIFIYMNKSIDTVVALLGVLKAGYSFFLVDTGWPNVYINSLIEDVKPDAIIFNSNKKPIIKGTITVEFKALSAKPIGDLRSEEIDNTNPIAYLTATSGTTGKPKIISTTHEAAIKLVIACHKRMALDHTRQYRIGAISCYSFDAALFEILFSLMNGFNLCIPSKDSVLLGKSLVNFINNLKIEIMLVTPTVIASLPDDYSMSKIEKLIIGGEPCPKAIIERYINCDLDIYIAYGVAEATIISTMKHISIKEDHMIIGTPLGGVECIVIASDGREAKDYHLGRLCIHGNLCDTERSSISNNSLLEIEHGSVVKKFLMTDDIVSKNHNGEFVFISRKSSLIKMNAVLINSTEIITLICSISGVKNAALFQAKSKHSILHKKLLCIYNTSNNVVIPPPTLKKHLLGLIPKDKVPSKFYNIKSWPINRNGKTDFVKLRQFLEISKNYKHPEIIGL